MKKGIIAFFHALLYPLIYFGSQIVASFAALMAFVITETVESGLQADISAEAYRLQNEFLPAYNQQILIASCVITCLIVLLIIKAGRRRLRDALVLKRLPVLKAGVVVLLGVSINIATMYALAFLPIPETIITQYEELISNAIVSDNIWMTLLTTSLFVPVTEELVFRGMSFNILRRGMSVTIAVILQTVIFAGFHLIPLQIAYVLPTALVLGLVYVWCGSFLAPVLLHVSYNGISAILNALVTAEETMETVAPQPIDFIVLAASIAVTVICLTVLWLTRKRGPEAKTA